MNLKDMLPMYRERAAAQNPAMSKIVEEFLAMSPSEQRELLFWTLTDLSQAMTMAAIAEATGGKLNG